MWYTQVPTELGVEKNKPTKTQNDAASTTSRAEIIHFFDTRITIVFET